MIAKIILEVIGKLQDPTWLAYSLKRKIEVGKSRLVHTPVRIAIKAQRRKNTLRHCLGNFIHPSNKNTQEIIVSFFA